VMVLTIDIGGDRKRIGLGEPGDQLILGDWDCDGVDTPGLYKPPGGVVQYFDVWPSVADQAYQPDKVETVDGAGRAELAEGNGSRCDRISVDAAAAPAAHVPEATPV